MPVDIQKLLSQLDGKTSCTDEVPLPTAPASNDEEYDFDFTHNVVLFPTRDQVAQALMDTTHAGGVDEMTRFQAASKAIGHFIRMAREGRYTVDEAWQATINWNQAQLSPPWDEDRLRRDFRSLLDADIRSKGPMLPPATHTAGVATDWKITDWPADRFAGKAPERQWVVEGLIPQGTAGTFAAGGDSGKSMLALKLALFITTAPPPNPDLDTSPKFFGCPVVARGAAVILTSEDDRDEVHRRLNALDPSCLSQDRPLYVVPMLNAGGVKAIVVKGANGPQATPFWYTLRDQLAAIPDLKLVVLDPLSMFVGADTNDNTVATFVMSLLAELATQTGAAIMLIHHVTKSAVPTDLRDARTAIRGAGAYVDNGRWAIVLWEADQEDKEAVLKALGDSRSNQAGVVYFGGLAKGNAPGRKMVRTLVRDANNGALEDATDAIRAAGGSDQTKVDQTVYEVLRKESIANPDFDFNGSENSLDKYWSNLLRENGLNISREKLPDIFGRLKGRGLIVKTGDKRGGYPVYKLNTLVPEVM